jgi:hypothetical protein
VYFLRCTTINRFTFYHFRAKTLRYKPEGCRLDFRCRWCHGCFFIDLIFPAALWLWGQLILKQKWVPEIFPRGFRRPVPRADKLATFMCRLSGNLGASASWKSQGLSRPVKDLLDLHHIKLSSSCPKLSRASQLNSPSSITGHFLWSMGRGLYPWILVSTYEPSALHNTQQLIASVDRNIPFGMSVCLSVRLHCAYLTEGRAGAA